MPFEIKTAQRKKSKIRLGLFGPSGSGKTYSALKVAQGLCGDWSEIVVIDTENNSATDYSDLGPFCSVNFQPPFSPHRYIDAIMQCENAGFEVIIIDSISHEWNGVGGCLELVEAFASKSGSHGGKFAGWKDVTPLHNQFINAILYAKTHVICCGRAKQDYAMVEGQNGKKEVQKLGVGVVTRDGFEYELKISLDINMKHYASVSEIGKDRTGLFDGKPPHRLTELDGEMIAEWCNSGADTSQEESEEKEKQALLCKVLEIIKDKNLDNNTVKALTGLETLKDQSIDVYVQAIERLIAA